MNKNNAAQLDSAPVEPAPGSTSGFSEAAAWRDVAPGWKPLSPGFATRGFSLEWHDFALERDLDWSASFHPQSVEICLNLAGHGAVGLGRGRLDFAANTAGFYRTGSEPSPSARSGGERHQFVTAEFSAPYLAERLAGSEEQVHPAIRSAMEGLASRDAVPPPGRLTASLRQTAALLLHPPVSGCARQVWYEAKALELLATFAFEPAAPKELFCGRQRIVAEERVQRVIALLGEDLAEPPGLEELGRKIGCSPFYLSRVFSNHTGQTISQYLRQIRMDKAAELLRAGKHNVTEAAMEVGYTSLSHFSQTFHETFGCCPGLYPIGLGKAWSRPTR
jgi:AraC-like DNA-binding protein